MTKAPSSTGGKAGALVQYVRFLSSRSAGAGVRPVHKSQAQALSIITTGRAPTLPLFTSVQRASVASRRCGSICAPAVWRWCAGVVWSLVRCARRSHPDRTPGPSRSSGCGASAGRGRFGAHGRGWRLPLVPRFAPGSGAGKGTDGSRTLLCCAVPCRAGRDRGRERPWGAVHAESSAS